MRVLLNHPGYGVRHAREGVRPRDGRGARVAREIDDQEVVVREEMGDDVGPFEMARGDAVEEDEGCLGGWVEGEEEEFLLLLSLFSRLCGWWFRCLRGGSGRRWGDGCHFDGLLGNCLRPGV